eukprot:1161712-Pelagomonas_calceolata.AAC.11
MTPFCFASCLWSLAIILAFSRSVKPETFDIRVRMGMASGVLQPGKHLHGHPTIEKAKGEHNST